jgi:hypothetical protein
VVAEVYQERRLLEDRLDNAKVSGSRGGPGEEAARGLDG